VDTKELKVAGRYKSRCVDIAFDTASSDERKNGKTQFASENIVLPALGKCTLAIRTPRLSLQEVHKK